MGLAFFSHGTALCIIVGSHCEFSKMRRLMYDSVNLGYMV